ncbi:MAG TPA: hypothetical protein VL401_00115 [Alphaproteobacteria bacterium]|jgi:hypothetical protein|nr:hypothetical protein [Alphaproteobacteria bacterium]
MADKKIDIKIIDEGDERTYNDLQKMPDGLEKKSARMDWETAGLVTLVGDASMLSDAVAAFGDAHIAMFKDGEVELQPMYNLQFQYSFLGNGAKENEAKLYQIKGIIVPKFSDTKLGDLKDFSNKVREIYKQKTSDSKD